MRVVQKWRGEDVLDDYQQSSRMTSGCSVPPAASSPQGSNATSLPLRHSIAGILSATNHTSRHHPYTRPDAPWSL